jgi:hypothetical protein
MDLLNHDCSISEKIIQLCLPPEKNESSRWTLAVVHYLSGVKFVNQNLTSVTSNHLAKAFVEFNQDQYQPHVARNADFPNIPRKKYPEDPIHSVVFFSFLFSSLPVLCLGSGYSSSHSSHGTVLTIRKSIDSMEISRKRIIREREDSKD